LIKEIDDGSTIEPLTKKVCKYYSYWILELSSFSCEFLVSKAHHIAGHLSWLHVVKVNTAIAESSVRVADVITVMTNKQIIIIMNLYNMNKI